MRDSPPEWERGFYMAKKREKFGWEAALREFRWSFVVAALAFVALGLVLILWPDASMHVLCYLVGGALTLYGGFNVLSFVFSQERAFTFELVIGVLTAAIGIFALLSPDSIRDILSVVLGLVVIIDSLIGIKRAFTLRELELSGWWVRLTLSVAAAILGVLFMLRKELFGRALLIVVGCVLLYQGLSDLFTVVQISVLGKRLKKRLDDMVQDNIIDAD